MTQTPFFLIRSLIINNLMKIAIHCNRYVTYQITLVTSYNTRLQKQFIVDIFFLTICITFEKISAIYRVYI